MMVSKAMEPQIRVRIEGSSEVTNKEKSQSGKSNLGFIAAKSMIC